MNDLIAEEVSKKKRNQEKEGEEKRLEQKRILDAKKEEELRIKEFKENPEWQEVYRIAHSEELLSILKTYFNYKDKKNPKFKQVKHKNLLFGDSYKNIPISFQNLTITENLEKDGWYPVPNINVNGIRIYFNNGVKFKILKAVYDLDSHTDGHDFQPLFCEFEGLNELAKRIAYIIANEKDDFDNFKEKISY